MRPLLVRGLVVALAFAPSLVAAEDAPPAAPAPDAPPAERKEPDPDAAGVPVALSVDFERADKGALPDGFHVVAGRWTVVDDLLAPGRNHVLLQGATVPTWATVLVRGGGHGYADGAASARVLLVSGRDDASGGIVFRARGPDDYYLVRMNALEDNLRLYVVKHGVRWQLATTTVTPPATGTWHALSVAFSGDTFRATLDGTSVVEAKDATFSRGWCGLWTKSDSVTRFDDFVVTPTAPASTPPAPPAPAPKDPPAPR
ncbi:MAG: hypothetical protein IT460_18475 [Planctomycetes bacterium]|nr:hypothetical protein [Planctomycetota bacterium]